MPRPYHPSILGVGAFPRSNPISSVKGTSRKGEPFVAKLSRHPPDPSTAHRRRSTTIVHPFSFPTSSISIAITIVIEISLRIGDHWKNVAISNQVFATMIYIFDIDIMFE
jgi:hypothetical protein